jgi:hypothetical protein
MSELTKRILTASALTPFILFLIFQSEIGFVALVSIGGLIVGYEFAKLIALSNSFVLKSGHSVRVKYNSL